MYIQEIIVALVIISALFYAISKLYKFFTGKATGCACCSSKKQSQCHSCCCCSTAQKK